MNEKFLFDIKHRYFLAQHIYYSDVDGHFIVLDLRKNKYVLLGETEKNIFRVLFENEDTPLHGTPHEQEQSIKEMVNQGLLTVDPQKSHQHLSSMLPPVTRDMNGYPP